MRLFWFNGVSSSLFVCSLVFTQPYNEQTYAPEFRKAHLFMRQRKSQPCHYAETR